MSYDTGPFTFKAIGTFRSTPLTARRTKRRRIHRHRRRIRRHPRNCRRTRRWTPTLGLRRESWMPAKAGTQMVGACRTDARTKASAIASTRPRRVIISSADRPIAEVPIHQRVSGIAVQPVRVLDLRICLGQLPQRPFGHAHRRGIDQVLVPQRQIHGSTIGEVAEIRQIPAESQHLLAILLCAKP